MAILMPRTASSPWILRYPQDGFSWARRRGAVRIGRPVDARPRAATWQKSVSAPLYAARASSPRVPASPARSPRRSDPHGGSGKLPEHSRRKTFTRTPTPLLLPIGSPVGPSGDDGGTEWSQDRRDRNGGSDQHRGRGSGVLIGRADVCDGGRDHDRAAGGGRRGHPGDTGSVGQTVDPVQEDEDAQPDAEHAGLYTAVRSIVLPRAKAITGARPPHTGERQSRILRSRLPSTAPTINGNTAPSTACQG